jgi:hypothetical protein
MQLYPLRLGIIGVDPESCWSKGEWTIEDFSESYLQR